MHYCFFSTVVLHHLKNISKVVSVVSLAASDESVFKPYNFKMEEIEGFRYRSKVALPFTVITCARDAYLLLVASI